MANKITVDKVKELLETNAYAPLKEAAEKWLAVADEKYGDKFDELKEKAAPAVADLKESVEELKESVGEIKEKAAPVVEDIREKVEPVAQKIREGAEDCVDAVKQAAKDVGDKLAGAVPGAEIKNEFFDALQQEAVEMKQAAGQKAEEMQKMLEALMRGEKQ